MIKKLRYKFERVFSLLTRNMYYNISYGQFNKDFIELYSKLASKNDYLKVYKEYKLKNTNKINNVVLKLNKKYNVKIPEDFINKLAFETQICIKKSEINYLHGFLLYSVLKNYLKKNSKINSFNILETGTARGFSAICMAKALSDSKSEGRIFTVDVLPVNKKIYWNCVLDDKGKNNRLELLESWEDLVNRYLIFIQSFSDLLAKQFLIPRIHFAFVDAQHDFKFAFLELKFISKSQLKGDLIVCDDYDKKKFPGVVKAINKFVKLYNYNLEIIKFSENSREYVLLTKKN